MNLFFTTVLAEGAAGTPPANGPLQMLTSLAPLIVLFGVFYFMIIRPQKKKEKTTREMIAALKVGDSIVTIGGIVGKINRIKDNNVVIETTKDCAKIELEKWAIKEVTTIKDV